MRERQRESIDNGFLGELDAFPLNIVLWLEEKVSCVSDEKTRDLKRERERATGRTREKAGSVVQCQWVE